ncbi:MAG: DNA methyltransferase, partial [Stenotrophobium sp.]
MSRLTDLLSQAKTKDPQMGADLEREFQALSSRLPFGLNFERHRPEAVELPNRPVRKGDKVRVLPERGSTTKADPALWVVKNIVKDGESKLAELEPVEASRKQASKQASKDDLVVVAEFRDTLYPGLKNTGRVSRGGDKPCHTVINGENYHVLKALTWTHRGKVDAIYIDPPYNTGAKDWKYNNDYVESDDLYRHSKWLAMMERRLKIAKELLNPADSVLIVTIDEKEYLRLGLLLEQVFPEARIQMISSVISQKGSARAGEFSRCDEFIYFVMFGCAAPLSLDDDMLHETVTSEGDEVEWGRLKRNGANGRRERSASLFYPIFLKRDGSFHSTGEPLSRNVARESIKPPEGTIAVF